MTETMSRLLATSSTAAEASVAEERAHDRHDRIVADAAEREFEHRLDRCGALPGARGAAGADRRSSSIPTSSRATNLANVVTRSAFIAIIAVGATFVISSGGLDLSVGSMAAFVTGITIMFMNALAPHAGIMGHPGRNGRGDRRRRCFAGSLNGLIVTIGRIEPFIATLGTMGIFRALITYPDRRRHNPDRPSLRDAYRPVYFGTFAGHSDPDPRYRSRSRPSHPSSSTR